MVLLALSSIITILVYVWPYQAAVPGLRYKPGFVIRQTSFAISNAIPAGGAFGLAVQLAMLRSYGVTLAVATAGIAVTSLWSVLMTLTLPVMGVLAALTTGDVESQWVWVALAGLAATVVSILLLWLILRSEPSARKVGSWVQRAAAPVNRRRAEPWDATDAVLGPAQQHQGCAAQQVALGDRVQLHRRVLPVRACSGSRSRAWSAMPR